MGSWTIGIGRAWLGALCMAAAAAPMSAGAVSVLSSPTGEVAQVRQVVLRFSAPVVPLGDLRLPDPASVACVGTAVKGSGRWSDDRTWVYDFRAALAPGSKCTAALKEDWKPLAAAGAVTGAKSFAFSTGGPAVASVSPGDGATIEEEQHFLLRLTGAAVPASVTANAWCEVQGQGERLPVAIVEGPARDALLKDRGIEKADEKARALLLRCPRPLPQAGDVRLVWGRGIGALANPRLATSVEQRWSFHVRPAFAADFSCQREKADMPCVPLLPMTLSFTAGITRAAAEQIRLVPAAGGTPLKPFFSKDDKESTTAVVAFPTPLAENASYAIELPKDLRDDSGRPLANMATFPLKVRTAGAPPIAKFAAAPFGIVEWNGGDAALPLTLRHVQGDLRKGSGPAGQVRSKRIESDADIHAWFAKVEKYHETDVSARDAGRPEREWFETVEEVDGRGRTVRRKVEKRIGTREVSLLDKETDAKRLELPQLEGGDPRPFEVVGIPMGEPGYHVVEIESRRLGEALLDKRAPLFVRTGVLVTNMGVHIKRGRENSLVWVTTLDRAKPVEAADVAVHDCNGKKLWAGRTDARGLAVVPRPLDAGTQPCAVDAGLFVTARKASGAGGPGGGKPDMAFVFSGWQKGIEPWRFGVPTGSPSSGSGESEVVATTVFDRTLLRAGETVSMKHFLRLETSRGLAPMPVAGLPQSMKLVHAGSGDEIALPLRWPTGARSTANAWTIPKSAKLGLYSVVYENGGGGGLGNEPLSWSGGSFRVEEFRLPLVDARLAGPKEREKTLQPQAVAIDVRMGFFSGGPMAKAPLQASALLAPRSAGFRGFEEFSFEPPRDRSATARSEAAQESETEDASRADGGRLVADKVALVTDKDGAATFAIPGLPPITRPSVLRAEVTYADPNGETQTASTSVELWPAGLVVGIRPASWTEVGKKTAVQAVALGLDGKPLAGQSIEIQGRAIQTFSTRKRLVGGFYAYGNRTEVAELGVLCSGKTDSRGVLACEVAAKQAGELELVARAVDAGGRAATAATSTTVVGEGQWFAQDNDDRIDILPEKKSYAPGEVANFQVRMPFREATALIAIEREGVIATKLVTLRGREPTVALTIEPEWGPNVFVSVLALRGRVRETPWYSFFTWGWREPASWWTSFRGDGKDVPQPTAMIDLAKPAFKLGVAQVRVGLEAHRLDVQVTADKAQYQVRQKAMATVKVTQGGKPLAGVEVAFAAVDEGLLALAENGSWKVLETMFRERSWSVETSTGQSEIIGRRHYGRKAVAAGGGGGGGATRELFDTLLVWKASVTLDANGEARIEVPLNDSLTSFRFVAVADGTAGDRQLFGTGSTSVKVSQDLQVLAGLPPLVREGDRFVAMLTLRNTTAKPMAVRATLAGTPTLAAAPGSQGASAPALAFPPQDVQLAPGAAQEIAWPVDVPADTTAIAWEASAEDTSGGTSRARDRLRVRQAVDAAVPIRVLQATLLQLDGTASLPVAAPADALAVAGSSGVKRGGLAVAVQPKLTGALPGVRRYFETYPFICLEQKTSKSIGLADRELWNGVAETLPTYLDSDGLANYFPPQADAKPNGSDRLTAYVIAATHEAGYAIPDATRARMLDGLAAFVTGRIERRFWSPRADLDVRKLAALEALSRHGRAEPTMLGSIAIAPNTWPTAAVIDWLRILKRVDGIPDRAAKKAEAEQILRGRLTWGGTTLRFSTEESDFWWWLMESGDANAAKLVLAVLDEPGWKEELPRLVVGALQRQKRGAWLTTTANLWGALALDKFGGAFESVPVAGRTLAETAPGAGPSGGAALVADWTKTPAGGASLLAWPAAAAGAARSPTSAATAASAPASLTVRQDGTGKPWLTVQSLAAVPLQAPLRAGYDLTRTVTPVQQKTPGRWSRGDVARVRVEVDALGDMTWVVVADPVPGGATILGSSLGRDSEIASRDGPASGAAAEVARRSATPVFVERAFVGYRAYFERMPRGKHVVEYTVRLNNPGRFALPPTRVEAMYAPETMGEIPNAAVEVGP